MNKKYEAIFIIGKVDDLKRVKDTIERIDNMVISEGGNIFHKEEIGIRKLAYEIKDNKRGYYYLINFEMSDNKKEDLGKISVKINTLEEVIKHIIIRKSDD